jgi:hypothetical protein
VSPRPVSAFVVFCARWTDRLCSMLRSIRSGRLVNIDPPALLARVRAFRPLALLVGSPPLPVASLRAAAASACPKSVFAPPSLALEGALMKAASCPISQHPTAGGGRRIRLPQRSAFEPPLACRAALWLLGPSLKTNSAARRYLCAVPTCSARPCRARPTLFDPPHSTLQHTLWTGAMRPAARSLADLLTLILISGSAPLSLRLPLKGF